MLLLSTFVMADVIARKAIPRPTLPIEKPDRPVSVHPPVRPIVNTGVVYQDNYYNTNVVNNCQRYMDDIDELNAYIDQIEKELAALKAKENARLQKTLKEKHQKELEKFDNRKSSIKSKNSIKVIEK